MIYVTLLDQFHPGIYSGQVIDVCNYLNRQHTAGVRLVAFLSVKELLRSDARSKIRHLSPNAIVLPAFPGLKNFEWTAIILFFVCLFTGERIAICRNAFCTKMALRVKKFGLLKKVALDGRSALSAEIGEYDLFPVDYLRDNIARIEGQAVNESDFRVAVSHHLVNYWIEKYNYQQGVEAVIPCTLDSKNFPEKAFLLSPDVGKIKQELGIKPTDIVLVYSGSVAPWQSFALIEKALTPLLDKDGRVKVLFLSRENEDNTRFQKKYKDRVFIKWVEHKHVISYLNCCDYGILLREQSDTNKVASPVKFAEYLYAGLPVLISENLGDFSQYVQVNDCGQMIKGENPDWSFLKKSEIETKEKCFSLAFRDFMKESEENEKSYSHLVSHLTETSR
ncbi:MAG: hypothetical protein R2813_09420 [Flavobacteriales bacterium]